tara:strand:+ start:1457 stop:3709 length:2253 start_codon:yes stop_codon:yes gene_type:complete
MNVLNQNTFLSDATLEVEATSFQYELDGLQTFINSTFSVQENGIGTPLYFKVVFLPSATKSPNFDEAKEYYLDSYLIDGQINVRIQTDIPVGNIYAYITFYNKEELLLSKYEKTFNQSLVKNNNITTNNFADLRIASSNAVSTSVQSQKEMLYQQSLEGQKDKYNQSYISDLFYILKKNKNVVVFFGVDQEGYFKDNNFLSFLNEDQDFNNYLSDNNFIRQVNTYVYNSEDKMSFNVEQPGITGLESVFGTFYQGNFTLFGNEFKKENFSLNIEVGMIDAITEYASTSLIPKLEEERNFITSLRTDLVPFIRVERNKIVKTLEGLNGIISSNSDDLKDRLFIYNSSNTIAVNSALKEYLKNVNKQITDLVSQTTDYEKRSNSKIITLQRDYDKTIDMKDAERAVDVIAFNERQSSINSINISAYRERAALEVQKYFNEDLGSEVDTKSGTQTADLESLALSYLSADSYYVRDKKVLSNDKNVFYDFSYDDLLQYIKAINEIVANDIAYDFKLSLADKLEKVTEDEFYTEQKSEQLTFHLNSLVVSQVPNLKTESDREAYLQSTSNIIKTFEIPTTLRTDLCVDNVSPSDQRNNGSRQSEISPTNFLGNNLFAFTIFNRLEPFFLKKFYEFYRIYEQVELDIDTLPIQSLFLYKYYRNELSDPEFLSKDELYKSFVVYGIIYFMFKSLFKVTILLPEQNDYVLLTDEVLSGLEAGKKYMCQTDYYTNELLGIKTPELLQISIYNRYFILEA